MIRVEHRCPDGSPFPVEFDEQADTEVRWLLDREHAPTALSPLADAVRREGAPGTEAAYAESGLDVPSPVRRALPRAHGWEYAPAFVLPADERHALHEGLARLTRANGSALGVWEHHCLPRVEAACAWLASAPVDTPFAVLAERRSYAWSHTAVAGLVARRDLDAVVAACEAVGADASVVTRPATHQTNEHTAHDLAHHLAHHLAQGAANDTTDADDELRRLARLDPDSPEGQQARRDHLRSFGQRSVGWSIDHPTLAERPELLDAQLRLLRREGSEPGAVTAHAEQRRRALATRVAGAFVDDGLRAAFERALPALDAFVPIREARARWQLVASGAMRGVVRERGRLAVREGVLDDVDDLFFLTPSEYDALAGDLRATVAARRADHRHWRAVQPPPVIGQGGDVTTASVGDVLRGVPAAAGVARGPARVITELDDVDRLRAGDVLVTTMTSPPWTPLFGLVVAVVADAGDLVSHVSIAAREYGIPCVVGTNDATRRIEDGTLVTVDGIAGTVHLG